MLHGENSAGIENKGTISAELTYIVRQKEKPYFESSHSTGGEPKVFFKTEKRNASISNMRPHVATLSIDNNGFELINHQTHADDLYNDDLIKAQYNQELDELLKQHTGADKVVIFDHTRRSNNDIGAKNPDGRRGPAVRVHADYTVKSGPQRAKDTLGEHEFNDIMANRGRVVQVNV